MTPIEIVTWNVKDVTVSVSSDAERSRFEDRETLRLPRNILVSKSFAVICCMTISSFAPSLRIWQYLYNCSNTSGGNFILRFCFIELHNLVIFVEEVSIFSAFNRVCCNSKFDYYRIKCYWFEPSFQCSWEKKCKSQTLNDLNNALFAQK